MLGHSMDAAWLSGEEGDAADFVAGKMPLRKMRRFALNSLDAGQSAAGLTSVRVGMAVSGWRQSSRCIVRDS